MPTLSISKTYQDGSVLLEADLDNIRDDIENFINGAQIGTDNLQNGGVQNTNLANNSVSTLKIQNEAVTRAKIEEAERMPIGAVLPFAALTPPTGYLMCDGSTVSRTTYAALFAVIGTSHGEGDTSTTFELPDYRGRFLRGVDDGAGRDPDVLGRTAMATGGDTGDAVGSVQTENTGNHTHGITDPGHNHSVSTNTGAFAVNPGGGPGVETTITAVATSVSGTGISVNGNGGSESRPINAYINFIIKF